MKYFRLSRPGRRAPPPENAKSSLPPPVGAAGAAKRLWIPAALGPPLPPVPLPLFPLPALPDCSPPLPPLGLFRFEPSLSLQATRTKPSTQADATLEVRKI